MSRTPTLAAPVCSSCGNRLHGAVCPFCGPLLSSATTASPSRAAWPALRDARTPAPAPAPHTLEPYSVRPIRLPSPLDGELLSHDDELAGAVVQAAPVAQIETPRNLWRDFSLLLVALCMLPALSIAWLSLLALQIALWLLGMPHLLGFLAWFTPRWPQRAAPAVAPTPVYDYVIQCGTRYRAARQIGEFGEGRIFAGDRVRLRGTLRGNVLIIESGTNETTGAHLAFPPNPWKIAAGFLTALLAAGATALFGAIGPAGRGAW